jgi:predicted nucleic acid-binding protein
LVILVDSSVWIDHFRKPNSHLEPLLMHARICCHPFVTGELVAGAIHVRHPAIAILRSLPQLSVADEETFYEFVARHELNGLGLGFVDLHLLTAVALSPGHSLWTQDSRLAGAAERLGIDNRPN